MSVSTTSSSIETGRPRQRGGALMEALVGMALLSIAVLGSMLALAHTTRTQHVNGVRAQVIDQIRTQFLREGAALCGLSVPVPVHGQTLSAQVSCSPYANVSVSFPGAAAVSVTVPVADAQVMTASVDSPLLGGVLTVSSAR